MTQEAHTELLDQPSPPPDTVPPIHPVVAILSNPGARIDGKPMLSYDANCTRLQSFYESLACPLWAHRLHTLSIATTDCVVALATARHCTTLSQSSGELFIFWPYDDGTLTSSDTNSLISKRTGPCYVKMNQSGHSVCSELEVQPT